MMHGVFLDTATVKPDELDFSALKATLPTWSFYEQTTQPDVKKRLHMATVVVTNKVVLDADIINSCPHLQLICVCATGTNNIDLQAARQRGIAVRNVSGYAGPAVAQHTLTLMLSLASRWHEYYQDVRAGEWSRASQFCLLHRPVMELAGKTLGIIGYGDLGQQVARLAEAFGMTVLVAQSLSGQPGRDDVPRQPMAALLAQADIVSLHCPLSNASEKLVNSAFIEQMKPTALLINTARGGLVDEPALATALRNGRLGGAALDVLSVEPPPADHPLLASDIPNLLITPHNAWVSRECRQRLIDGVVANIEQWRAADA